MVVNMSKNLFEELGINLNSMTAPEIEAKLNTIKESLDSSYKQTMKNIDDAIHDAAKDDFKKVSEIQKSIDDENAVIEAIDSKINKLMQEQNTHYDKKRNYEWDIKHLTDAIYARPEIIKLGEQRKGIRDKYNNYIKLLDREARKIVSANIRNDLINSIKSVKQIESKKK